MPFLTNEYKFVAFNNRRIDKVDFRRCVGNDCPTKIRTWKTEPRCPFAIKMNTLRLSCYDMLGALQLCYDSKLFPKIVIADSDNPGDTYSIVTRCKGDSGNGYQPNGSCIIEPRDTLHGKSNEIPNLPVNGITLKKPSSLNTSLRIPQLIK